jgi:hypothetical protein
VKERKKKQRDRLTDRLTDRLRDLRIGDIRYRQHVGLNMKSVNFLSNCVCVEFSKMKYMSV